MRITNYYLTTDPRGSRRLHLIVDERRVLLPGESSPPAANSSLSSILWLLVLAAWAWVIVSV